MYAELAHRLLGDFGRGSAIAKSEIARKVAVVILDRLYTATLLNLQILQKLRLEVFEIRHTSIIRRTISLGADCFYNYLTRPSCAAYLPLQMACSNSQGLLACSHTPCLLTRHLRNFHAHGVFRSDERSIAGLLASNPTIRAPALSRPKTTDRLYPAICGPGPPHYQYCPIGRQARV